MSSKLAVVFGGSGFIGRNVIRELTKRGWRVRAAVRRPHLAQFLRPMGAVGQVQLAQANVRYRGSVSAAMDGADAVINLVGVLSQSGSQSFQAVQAAGARVVAECAAEEGVETFIHVSAIGADSESDSLYARTKGEGEIAVRTLMPHATIVRPSIVFGQEDEFFNKFAAIASYCPALPLFGGGRTRFQPVYVDDVADGICSALSDNKARGQIYEFGGPRICTFKELMQLTLQEIGKSRILAPIPFVVAPLIGIAGEMIGWAPMFDPPITRDQIKLLKTDNVVDAQGENNVGTLADLGIAVQSIESVLPSYLVRFRKYGQFAEVPS